MNQKQVIMLTGRHLIVRIILVILLIAISPIIKGQEPPPFPMTVTPSLTQNLSFGAFYQGAGGGSVIIAANGSRSSTGDIVLLNMGFSYAAGLFDIVSNPGTLVSVMNGSDAILTGSNGGLLTLKLGNSSPLSPFIITTTPPTPTQMFVGATLLVGSPASNPPGNYTGTFNITFVQE
jgi:hypothetical protein